MALRQLDYAAPASRRPISRAAILKLIAAGATIAAIVLLFIIIVAGDVRTPSNYSEAIRQIQHLDTAIDVFAQDVRRPPTTGEGLGALLTAPAGAAGWKGPYTDPAVIARADPYGNLVIYRTTAKGWEVFSAGPDGVADTEDDVSNLGPRKPTTKGVIEGSAS